ncbi:hypothetical protein HL653_01030 [Sphingomonas sp. AP4-R1]|uniref:hypothetical protein n=1 Tax=Sphingomonas sp. AP4-R1 TaxID=2735134 RepID=UPI001493939B|nr:hypothetical protein [Sphingomonas sp. AP4-R1]QJU56553.1 hypothetical protein HL653_01030 [Sphingomonas sp. AP4-R1]
MARVWKKAIPAVAVASLVAVSVAEPASAYLFWRSPQLKGEPVTGDEPGLLVPLPGATPKEVKANLLWGMRAGLNVAALQCQFAPSLLTVSNYNALLRNHSAELQDAYNTLVAYFKRQSAAPVAAAKGKAVKGKPAPKAKSGGISWQTAIDQFSTRTYNGFSTFHGQLEFCETASSLGREALAVNRGELLALATARMREFRNSLSPAGDMVFAYGTSSIVATPMPSLTCVNKKGKEIPCKD